MKCNQIAAMLPTLDYADQFPMLVESPNFHTSQAVHLVEQFIYQDSAIYFVAIFGELYQSLSVAFLYLG
jgi:hypothetical protein